MHSLLSVLFARAYPLRGGGLTTRLAFPPPLRPPPAADQPTAVKFPRRFTSLRRRRSLLGQWPAFRRVTLSGGPICRQVRRGRCLWHRDLSVHEQPAEGDCLLAGSDDHGTSHQPCAARANNRVSSAFSSPSPCVLQGISMMSKISRRTFKTLDRLREHS
jgi:hypothetical protein